VKVKYNVKGVKASSGNFEPIPKGVYPFTVESCEVTKPKGMDQRIEAVYVIEDGDQEGRKLWDYINLESDESAWKVRQFLETFGIVTEDEEVGEFDPADIVGEKGMVRVVHQPGRAGTQWEGTIQSKVGGTFAPDGDEEKAEEDLDEEKEAEEPEEDAEDGEEDAGVDLDELDRAGLKALIKEEELEIKVLKKMSDDDIREAITEAMSDDEDAEDEDEEDEEEESEKPDYDEMSKEELVATCKERGLKTTGIVKILRARLVTDDESGDKSGDPF